METAERVPSANKMAAQPVGRLLFTLSLPIMLSMIMEALYNVVDSLFVARLGEKALTALSLAFPVQLLVVSIAVGTGVGVGAALSRRLGEKDTLGVSRVAGNGITLSLLTYLLFLVFGLFFTRAYFASQTGDAEIIALGVDYLGVCMIWSFGSVGQITLQRLLQSTGKTMLSMVSQLVGALLNIVLDPILIFGLLGFPAMGVKGAAIATVIGQIVAMGIAVYFNLAKNHEIHFSMRTLRLRAGTTAEIYRVGAPAIVMQSLNSLMALGVNLILMPLSATAVAAFGVYVKVQNFIFMPAFGLNNGVIAIGAFNYGAGEKRRVDETIMYGMVYAGIILMAGTLLLHVLARPILGLFDASPELMSIGVVAIRVISLSYIFVAFTLICQGIYQALGNGLYSLIITLMRVVIILLPVMYVFARIFPLEGVWWAFVLAEGGSAVVAAFLLRHIYAQRVAPLTQRESLGVLQNRPLEGHAG